MHLKLVADQPDLVEVRASGRITPDTFSTENEPLARLLGANVYARAVALSLEKTDYINSSGVGWLLVCHKRFREAGGRLIIHSIPPLVLNVLKVLKMDRVFHLEPDMAGAKAALAQDDA